jgi:hypothetical protein
MTVSPRSRPIKDQKSSPKLRKKLVLGLVLLVVAVAVVLGVTLSGPSKNTTTTTHPTTTTTSRQSATPTQAAATASLSVVRAAMYHTRTAATPVHASDIVAAAKPDKGTLVIVHNLGTIAGHGNVVVFSWHLGGSPVINCIKVPPTRAAFPTTLKEEAKLIIACPPGTR